MMLTVETWPLDKIIPYDKNAKLHHVEWIAQSISEFSIDQPIVVDGQGVIIKGHGRLKAAKQLGLTEFPVVVRTDLTPEQIRLARIADNRSAEGGWDSALLGEELNALLSSMPDYDFDALGLSEDWFSSLDVTLDTAPAYDDAALDNVPELNEEEEPITKPGDLWQLGKHRLLCGDATKREDVERVMNGKKADMIFTDPPYGVSYVGKTKDALTIESDNFDEQELSAMIEDCFSICNEILRPGAYTLATVPAGPLHLLFALDWKKRGWLRQILVWNKNSMVLGHSEYHYKHEPILFGWKPGERLINKDRTKTSVWDFDRPSASKEHPTMKPVEMWSYGINNHSKKGDLLYDPFGGSGTSLIACEQTGRVCYGLEISPHYCDVIVKRWETLTGNHAVLL